MARRSSQRKKQSAADKQKTAKPLDGKPRSMVIRIGAQEVGSSVSQLVQDVRHVMEPDTAVRLKVCRHAYIDVSISIDISTSTSISISIPTYIYI